MKQLFQSIQHQLLTALAGLLLAAPGAWAQGGTAPIQARQVPVAAPALTSTPTAGAAAGVLVSNKIQFHGQAPDLQTNYRADPLDVCPNVIDPTNPSLIQGQPYQFEFESNCDGKIASWYDECRARPNFIWTIKYFTESGAEYQEKWRDVTTGDFSKIRLYLYDRVPYAFTPTNGQATQGGGNPNFSAMPYPNDYCINQSQGTAQPGELITNVRLECTGYTCGFSGLEDDDAIEIRYYNRRPGAISVAGNPAEYCRDQPYTLNWGGSFGATSYNVSASNGAQVSGISGTAATLNLANVPRTATSVTVTVTAVNAANRCGTTLSASRIFTLPVRRAPAQPANMQIDGVCPSTTAKTITINAVSLPSGEPANTPILYQWSISGSNTATAQLLGGSNPNTISTNTPYVQISTPNIGEVTVNVEARASLCGGPGLVLSRTFQIGNVNPVCPTASVSLTPCSATFTLNGTPGLSYYITSQPYNFTNADGSPNTSATASIGSVASPTITTRPFSSNSNKVYFDVDVFVASPCATGPGFVPCTINVFIPKFNPTPCLTADVPTTPVATSRQTVQLYPNPATGVVVVQSDTPTRYQWVKVLNLQGRVVLSQEAPAATGITTFDVRDLPAGLYEVQLFDGKKHSTQRLQKE